MYIVISKNYREFVAGVFSSKDKSDKFIDRIPDNLGENVKTISIEMKYPFYITEDHNGFCFYSESEIIQKIDEYISEMDRRDEGWFYTNMYRVDNDFEPRQPGKDNMGLLKHYHVENETLRNIMKNGFNKLW